MLASVDQDVPASGWTAIRRLRQVMINVVGNAVKFTNQGEIEMRVSRLGESAGSVTLQFTVRDTGIGIPAHKQQSVFEAFEQGDASTTREYGGTGLGLAISSRLVELMSGRMWESWSGSGSRFTERLFRQLTGEPLAPATLPKPE
jgi:signal transduction histidine kinase